MKCPVCKADSIVLTTRNEGTRRRRECFNGHRFSTQEVLVEFTNVGGHWQKKMKIVHTEQSPL